MPDYRRAYVPGGTYFFTVNTYGRGAFLLDEPVRRALREGIRRARDELPFVIEAWVLLPDHLHCIWTLPPGDADFSKRWAIIKRTVSKRCGDRIEPVAPMSESRRPRKEAAIWQRRFWEHQIRDERVFAVWGLHSLQPGKTWLRYKGPGTFPLSPLPQNGDIYKRLGR